MDIEDVDMTKTVADPGEGPGGPASSPLDQREEIFLGDWAPPLSKGLDDPPPPLPPPSLSQDLDLALKSVNFIRCLIN